MKAILFVILGILPGISTAANGLFLGFGEIPVLAESFKPSIGYIKTDGKFGYALYLQLEDQLQRNGESFNADFGQQGLQTSEESTGARAMVQVRYYLLRDSIFLSLAAVATGEDSEAMEFDHRTRSIGPGIYDSSISVRLDRKSSVEPAIGVGLSLPVSKRLRITSDFTMAWFGQVPTPDIAITTSANVSDSDLAELEAAIRRNYESNFHNRYHLFNLGLEYRF